MKTNLLLLSAAALVSTSAMGAAKVPMYKSIDFNKIGLAVNYLQGNVNVVDVNNDGYYDLLLKGRDMDRGWAPQIAISLGSANGLTTCTILDDPDNSSWQRVLTYLDYNNDGILDFILGQDRGNFLYTGNGKGEFVVTPKEDFVFNDGYGMEAAEAPSTYMPEGLSETGYDGITVVADFNNDGISDVICYNSTETIKYENTDDQGNQNVWYNVAKIHPAIFLGNGDGTFTVIDETGMDPLRAGTFSVADFDRDGILDVVANGWLDSLNDGALRLYKGNGDGTFTAMTEINEAFDAVLAGAQKGRVLFVDINGDGYADIFQTGQTFHNSDWGVCTELWINNNGTSFTKSTFDFSKELVAVMNSGADWADLNNDGLMDLVFAGADKSGGALSVVAINEGDGTFNCQDDKIMGTRSGVSVAAVDFDEDGVVDIMTMGYNGTQNFNVYNGSMKSKKDVNTAPAAPENLAMEANGSSVKFTWDAATDDLTPAAALLYNVYVKTNDGKLHFNILADPATGHLRNTEMSGAICTTFYTMNINPATIKEWGVQTIDGSKWTSKFSIYDMAGIEGIAADDVNAPAVYYNMQGVRVNNPENGIFIEVKNGKAQKVQF